MDTLTQLLADYRLTGLAIGLVTFLVIGLFHPLVIKGEYYLGAKLCSPLFLCGGILAAIASVAVDNTFLSPVLGVVAFSSFWSIKEVYEQRGRVERGWFPRNPKHQPAATNDNTTVASEN